MADDVLLAHYQRVWNGMPEAVELPVNGVTYDTRAAAVVAAFVLLAVIDQRPLTNVVTQWDIDADSVIEQSLAELRGFKACLPGFLDAEPSMPAKVRDAYAALADYFDMISRHAGARAGLTTMWRDMIPQVRAGIAVLPHGGRHV
jgi:hypothetical protein